MKLPDITYKKVSGPRGAPGPDTAVREHYAKQKILGQAFQVANDFAEQHAEYEANKVNSEYADDMTQLKTELATKRVATPDEIEEWGLSDQVSTTNADGSAKEYIPKHEWYSKLLANEMERMTTEKAGKINSPKYREAWLNRVRDVNRGELERSVVQSARDAHEYQQDRVVNDVETALTAGRFQTARDILADPMFAGDPELKANLMNTINVAEEKRGLTVMARDASPAELRAKAEEIGTDEYNEGSALDAEELERQREDLLRMADAKETEATALNKERNERLSAAWWDDYLAKAGTTGVNASDLAGLSDLPFLDKSDIKAAWKIFENAAENGSPFAKEYDPVAYNEVQDAIDSGDPVAAKKALEQNIPSLDKSTYKTLDGQVRDLVDAPDTTSVTTDTQIVSDMLVTLGVDTTKTSENLEQSRITKARVRSMYAGEVARKEANLQRKLTDEERIDIADNLTRRAMTDDGIDGGFLFFDKDPTYQNIYDQAWDVVGEDQVKYDQFLRNAEAALKQEGRPVSDANLREKLQLWKKLNDN